MKVQAKQWVNHNGHWHMNGAVFEVSDKDYACVKAYVDPLNEPAPEEPIAETQQPKRRKRKTDE